MFLMPHKLMFTFFCVRSVLVSEKYCDSGQLTWERDERKKNIFRLEFLTNGDVEKVSRVGSSCDLIE